MDRGTSGIRKKTLVERVRKLTTAERERERKRERERGRCEINS